MVDTGAVTAALVPMGCAAKFSASIIVVVGVSLSAVKTVAWNSRSPSTLLIMPMSISFHAGSAAPYTTYVAVK